MGFFRRHRILAGLALVMWGFGCFLIAGLAYLAKGPYRSYRLDVVKPAPGAAVDVARRLEVGVAMRDITPDLDQYDTFVDADNNGRYEPKKGDSFVDRNGNGKFDAVWLAGFNNNRPAKGVHDPLWARAIAVRNNGVTVVMVTIDSIGMTHERFIKIRKTIDPALGIDHVMFSCTHNHEAPDTMGIWSYYYMPPLGDQAYIALVLEACREAVEEAVRNLEPADLRLAQAEIEPEGFMRDSRLPHVYDLLVCCARFTRPGSDETIATVVSWGNHVETLGSSNSLITSDYPHFLRLGVENGVPEPNGAPGLGGMCLFFVGNIGGLMTQLNIEVPHRDGVRKFKEASFDKAQALGENVALVALEALRGPDCFKVESPKVAFAAKTVFAPISGTFAWPIFLGVLHPGWFWGKARTEVNAIRIGDLEILTCPGELYPEIAEGGVESPDGADFPGPPIESPPLRKQMRGKVNMMFNLANDEIGYIIPKTQWDTKPPYAYNRDKPQYGEENSGGPDVAPLYHRESLALLERLHAAL